MKPYSSVKNVEKHEPFKRWNHFKPRINQISPTVADNEPEESLEVDDVIVREASEHLGHFLVVQVWENGSIFNQMKGIAETRH